MADLVDLEVIFEKLIFVRAIIFFFRPRSSDQEKESMFSRSLASMAFPGCNFARNLIGW